MLLNGSETNDGDGADAIAPSKCTAAYAQMRTLIAQVLPRDQVRFCPRWHSVRHNLNVTPMFAQIDDFISAMVEGRYGTGDTDKYVVPERPATTHGRKVHDWDT